MQAWQSIDHNLGFKSEPEASTAGESRKPQHQLRKVGGTKFHLLLHQSQTKQEDKDLLSVGLLDCLVDKDNHYFCWGLTSRRR